MGVVKKEAEPLKGCPFCGAPAEEPYRHEPRLGKTPRPLWQISCTWHCVSMFRGGRAKVVKDWNKRAG